MGREQHNNESTPFLLGFSVDTKTIARDHCVVGSRRLGKHLLWTSFFQYAVVLKGVMEQVRKTTIHIFPPKIAHEDSRTYTHCQKKKKGPILVRESCERYLRAMQIWTFFFFMCSVTPLRTTVPSLLISLPFVQRHLSSPALASRDRSLPGEGKCLRQKVGGFSPMAAGRLSPLQLIYSARPEARGSPKVE